MEEALCVRRGIGDAELLKRLAAVVDYFKGDLDALAGGVGIVVAAHQGAA